MRYGTVAGCIWLRVYGTSEMDRADLLMVPLWKFAHGGLHVEICSCWTPCGNLLMLGLHVEICPLWTPCGNLLMLDSMWKSAMVDSTWKSAHVGDSIVQLSSVQYE
ncbi:hypothetical protein MHB56_18955 [Paenibacillus sp. FSL H8-0315]|uniref:hypothetical protein n=1 Tax=Paenibacillus sp. FSL H8-0315 TaxID=2921384 RepID=UPI0030F67BFD